MKHKISPDARAARKAFGIPDSVERFNYKPSKTGPQRQAPTIAELSGGLTPKLHVTYFNASGEQTIEVYSENIGAIQSAVDDARGRVKQSMQAGNSDIPLTVHIRTSDAKVRVAPDQSVLDALAAS